MLDGVTNVAAANELAGRQLLALAEELPEFEVEEGAMADVGLTIVDRTYGNLGQVTDVLDTPAQPIWVVGGRYGELMIPVVGEFIIERSADQVTVCLPDGLVSNEIADPVDPCDAESLVMAELTGLLSDMQDDNTMLMNFDYYWEDDG
jgi:16S rRNA processing protein RimM